MNRDKNSRFCSYEHFHRVFEEEYYADTPGIDFLTLHLFAYLASWGMLRGSTFSLQKDYLFHRPVVEILLDRKYRHLLNIKIDEMTEADIELIFEVADRIINYYKSQTYFKDSMTPIEIKDVTPTLITKILMGAYACVPAFDNNVVTASRKMKDDLIGVFNKKAVQKLIAFYNKNKDEIDDASRRCSKERAVTYSEMKIIDMYLWKIGK